LKSLPLADHLCYGMPDGDAGLFNLLLAQTIRDAYFEGGLRLPHGILGIGQSTRHGFEAGDEDAICEALENG
jgi:hypothetical protein